MMEKVAVTKRRRRRPNNTPGIDVVDALLARARMDRRHDVLPGGRRRIAALLWRWRCDDARQLPHVVVAEARPAHQYLLVLLNEVRGVQDKLFAPKR